MSSVTTGSCPACGGISSSGQVHVVPEMMFGTGARYRYQECGRCGSLSLLDPPAEAVLHYPPEYRHAESGLSSRCRPRVPVPVVRSCLDWSTVSSILARRGGSRAWLALLRHVDRRTDMGVLDVGCGDGHRLAAMGTLGLTQLTGVDPYLEPGPAPPGVTLCRGQLEDLTGKWGLIMFHHSLEHLPDPGSSLASAARLLASSGHVLVRIPLAGRFAWRRYRTRWVQIDAPRHTLIPTPEGLQHLVAAAGLEVVATVYDSGPFQFWGSEQYERGIPLCQSRRPTPGPGSLFSKADIRRYRRLARRLNHLGDGDQAAFLCRQARS